MAEKDFEKFEQNLKWFSGYITEPTITYTEAGKCKTSFSIPLKKNKDDTTLWLNGITWGDMAEQVSEYKKGTLVLVGGNFSEREYKEKTYLDFNVKAIFKC